MNRVNAFPKLRMCYSGRRHKKSARCSRTVFQNLNFQGNCSKVVPKWCLALFHTISKSYENKEKPRQKPWFLCEYISKRVFFVYINSKSFTVVFVIVFSVKSSHYNYFHQNTKTIRSRILSFCGSFINQFAALTLRRF